MQNIVSKQTAIALREAGFPQPTTVMHGQVWYSCYANPLYIDSFIHKTGVPPYEWFACYPAYAPTADEILQQIPSLASLFFDIDTWVCQVTDPGNLWLISEEDETPAEAVAAAWLTYNRNK